MRIWDLHPGYLNRGNLLGEHRELHGLFNVLSQGKAGYSRHPETLRWQGCLPALAARHQLLVAEMKLRGYQHHSPLQQPGPLSFPSRFLDLPHRQFQLLEHKNQLRGQGRIPLPHQAQELWSQHKYMVLALAPQAYRQIGPALAHDRLSFAELALLLVKISRLPAQQGPWRNALEHMWGYFSPEDKPGQEPSLEALQALQAIHPQAYIGQSTALTGPMAWRG